MKQPENKSSHDIQELFIDGISNLSYVAGTFRFDLVTIYPDSNKPLEGDSKTNSGSSAEQMINKRAHIVMSPQGYAQMINMFKKFLTEVEQKSALATNK